MRDDALSSLLAWVRLRGESVYQRDLVGSWSLDFAPGASHVHFIESGQARLAPNGGAAITLGAGDLALLPLGRGHRLFSDPEGGATPETRVIGGLFHYERQPLPPVFRRLPAVIHLAQRDGTAPDWLGAIAHFLMLEVNHPAPGSALMISRIIDLMVIRTLRSWQDHQPGPGKWLGGGREERLGQALAAMHEEPAAAWTVEELARLAGMSRSVFAERFSHAFGEPPLRYLMRWRFTLASEMLAEGDLPVGEIARLVGYDSEAGFSRAFKAFHGMAPSRYSAR